MPYGKLCCRGFYISHKPNMEQKNTYLAVDFGGGSGRVMAGYIVDGRLQTEEIHRFSNQQVRIGRYTYWNFPSLFAEMKEGLRKAAHRPDLHIRSIGVDTWGVDFALTDSAGNLLALPVTYRDRRTEGLSRQFMATCDADAHYAEAGLQTMDINTLYQLLAMQHEQADLLAIARHLLFMPDLFAFYLCGSATCEYTIASTSELLDARTRWWNEPLIRRLGLRSDMFPAIVMPGTKRGTLMPDVARELGLAPDVQVIAVGSHDTQSAAFAAPIPAAESATTAFLSSGTWSLLGIDLPEPVLSPEARKAGYSNEGSVSGGVNFLQNITGLWFLQQLQAEWRRQGCNYSHAEMVQMAEAHVCPTLIDVDDPAFANPQSMEQAITDYCRRNGLDVPASHGAMCYCVIHSLARRYAKGIAQLNALLPAPVRKVCIIGGGSRNTLLNRLTAEATGLEVYTGPAEATAIGNILVQAIAMGDIAGKDQVAYC